MDKDEALVLAIQALEDAPNWGDDRVPIAYINLVIHVCKNALKEKNHG